MRLPAADNLQAHDVAPEAAEAKKQQGNKKITSNTEDDNKSTEQAAKKVGAER